MNKKSLVYSILIYVIFCLIPVKTLYANQNLTKAVELMDELQYEEAAHLINMARTTKGNKKTDLIDIYKLTGIVSAITENEGKAVWAFQRLLCIQPEFQLPKGSSPKIAKLFKEAKSSISRRGTLALFQKQLKTPYLDKSIMLKVELKDPLNMVDSIVYSFRKRGDENFLRGKMEKVIHFRGIIPPVPANKDGSSPALEY
nr:hypothetical protein [Candidatus Brocadiales bacterium]